MRQQLREPQLRRDIEGRRKSRILTGTKGNKLVITQFDKATCRTLGLEIEAALAAVAAKHGLKATYGGGSFDPSQFTCKIRLELATDNPNAETAERAKFTQLCDLFNLKADDYGAVIRSHRHGDLTIVGFEPSRPKFPIKVRKADGTLSVFSRDILALLSAQRTSAKVVAS